MIKNVNNIKNEFVPSSIKLNKSLKFLINIKIDMYQNNRKLLFAKLFNFFKVIYKALTNLENKNL